MAQPTVSKSLRRTSQYQIGGALALIVFPTLSDNGVNNLTVTRDAGGIITGLALATGVQPQILEFEDGTCGWSDNTTIGTNKYPKHTVGLKYAGRSDAANEVVTALDLGRHSALVKTKNGKCVLLGEKNGLTAEKNESGAGAGADDFAGYDLVISGPELAKAPLVPITEFNTLAGLVVD
jgi:hypothetical protein